MIPPLSPTELLAAMVGILGINHLLMRFQLYLKFPPIYWVIQLINLAIIAYVLILGLPGLTGQAKLINWIIGLVVAMHLVQNHGAVLSARSQARREELDREWEALEIRREQLRREEAERKSQG